MIFLPPTSAAVTTCCHPRRLYFLGAADPPTVASIGVAPAREHRGSAKNGYPFPCQVFVRREFPRRARRKGSGHPGRDCVAMPWSSRENTPTASVRHDARPICSPARLQRRLPPPQKSLAWPTSLVYNGKPIMLPPGGGSKPTVQCGRCSHGANLVRRPAFLWATTSFGGADRAPRQSLPPPAPR